MSPMDVRTEGQTKEVASAISEGPVTLVLFWADYCGYCHNYMPTWDELCETPGRKANVIKIHYDMVNKIPVLKKAKLEGYPSVIKVSPDGSIEEYTESSGKKTNAMPHMRDKEAMVREMKMESVEKHKNKVQTNQVGGVVSAFIQAIQKAGPASLLLLAHNALTKKGKSNKSSKSNKSNKRRTFKSPKRSSRRGSTRKN